MAFRPRIPFSTVINRLGLPGLKLCLDAGDIASYAGSGQVWADTSGNGHDFNRGATSAAEGSDPTFNGVAGALSANEFWSVDGGDYFTLAAANPSWVQNIHRDNAKFWIAAWAQIVDDNSNNALCGTLSNTLTGNTGFHFGPYLTDQLALRVQNAGASALNLQVGGLVSNGVLSFIAVSNDEAADSCIIQLNGTQGTHSGAYSSPSAGNASFTLQVMAAGNNSGFSPNTSRMYMIAIGEGSALTAQQMMDLYTASHSLVFNPRPMQSLLVR